MLTHRDLMVGMVHTYLQGFPELEIGEHRTITHLPLAHLVERSMSMCLMMIADVIPHIGEEAENLRETLTEVEPTFFHAVPRVWEKIASQILVNIDRSTWMKRRAYGSPCGSAGGMRNALAKAAAFAHARCRLCAGACPRFQADVDEGRLA